jgi:hypothetical protein
MKTDTISNIRPVGGDYFFLFYNSTRHNLKPLKYWLEEFKVEDYWIYKATGKQKLVSIEELKEFKYSGYIFFHKSKYIPENMQQWIDFITVQFMDKPTPPFPPTKIIVRR